MKTETIETPTQFKKNCLAKIMQNQTPFWCGMQIEEIDFQSMNLGGKLDIVLQSGKTVNVDMNEITFN